MIKHTPDPAARQDVKAFLERSRPVDAARVAMHLEDFQHTFRFMGSGDLLSLNPSPAQAAAARTFSFAADALLVFLEDAGVHPYDMATRTGVWATEHVERRIDALPAPLKAMLNDTFPEIEAWFRTVTTTEALTPEQAGECAAWWAVALILTWSVMPYEDGASEDLCARVLDALETPAPRVTH